MASKFSILNSYTVMIQQKDKESQSEIWDIGSSFDFGLDYINEGEDVEGKNDNLDYSKFNISAYKSAIMIYTFLEIDACNWSKSDVIYYYANSQTRVRTND